MKISIIIPFYNAARHLTKSISSVINQTYKDLEIILVNDASTDKSLEIAKSLEKKDSRIVIINKVQNEKALKARETGLRNSTADFVLFFDADDFMPHDAVEKMAAAQLRCHSDIVLGAFCVYYDRWKFLKLKPKNLATGELIEGTYDKKEINQQFGLSFYGIHTVPVTSPGKLFRRRLFDNFLNNNIPPIHAFDDTYMNLLVFPEANRITFIENIIFYYRYGGVTSTVRYETLDEFCEVHKLRMKILEEESNDKAYYSSMIEFRNTVYQYFYNLRNIKKISYPVFYEIVDNFKIKSEYQELASFLKTNNSVNTEFLGYILKDSLPEAYKTLEEKSLIKLHKKNLGRLIGKILRNI